MSKQIICDNCGKTANESEAAYWSIFSYNTSTIDSGINWTLYDICRNCADVINKKIGKGKKWQ